MAQGNGRDHHMKGFSMWLAGGGIKPGTTYGATDELGYNAVENVVEVHDLHATMLRLLGIDHEKLTVRYQGRDFRLTDVRGHVVTGGHQPGVTAGPRPAPRGPPDRRRRRRGEGDAAPGHGRHTPVSRSLPRKGGGDKRGASRRYGIPNPRGL